MIKRYDERIQSERVGMREGPGSVQFREIASKAEMYERCRLFSELTLNENCGIGYHVHNNESEIFIIKSGKAIYNDNGTEYEVSEGDVMICASGEGHAIRNEEKQQCSFIAMIVLDEVK